MKELREEAGGLTPGEELPHGAFGMQIYKKITEHLYEYINTSQEREKFEKDFRLTCAT